MSRTRWCKEAEEALDLIVGLGQGACILFLLAMFVACLDRVASW